VVGRSPAGDFDGRTDEAVAQLFLRGLDRLPSLLFMSPDNFVYKSLQTTIRF
jgi:hypothetical protein